MTQYVDTSSVIPSNLADTKAETKNYKFLIGGVLLLAVVVGLIVYSTFSTAAYYMTVSEVNQEAAKMVGQRVRVSGQVVANSEDWNPQEVTLRFSIHDETGAELPVVFFGPRPDNFLRAAEAIAEGTLLADGSFQADTLLLKCPSRYEEEPEEVFVRSER
ncbi:cytochrome c maturation protein CcmE [bacterium]|nr:cytochrome c maturation protein CcmE [bacterium]